MEIYEPREDSYLLQKFVRKYSFGRVLDVGTGSGIQALTAIEDPNVKEVIAIDINEDVISQLKEQIRERKLRKIKVFKSDLFENVHGHFSLIVFNPPYLPQDKGIEDPALYGGKNGWEISERFFKEVSKFLFPDGRVLFLFSTLTNKDKIEEILKNNLLQFKEIGKQKLAFEELYVYEIEKTELLRQLESKSLTDIHYFAHGKRGNIYTASLDRSKTIKTHFSKREVIKVAIKVKKEESKAEGRIQNESKWLRILNRNNIGPRLLFYEDNFITYKFVEGELILDWMEGKSKEEIKTVLKNLLYQCYSMDVLKVNKEEMHHPLKHIFVKDNNPVQIDFERCHETDKPHNVTQFIEFICRINKDLEEFDCEKLRGLAREYKDTYNEKVFKEILGQI
jgi:release factor glutamine methyltransferase